MSDIILITVQLYEVPFIVLSIFCWFMREVCVKTQFLFVKKSEL